jgi:hypothetical protein
MKVTFSHGHDRHQNGGISPRRHGATQFLIGGQSSRSLDAKRFVRSRHEKQQADVRVVQNVLKRKDEFIALPFGNVQCLVSNSRFHCKAVNDEGFGKKVSALGFEKDKIKT